MTTLFGPPDPNVRPYEPPPPPAPEHAAFLRLFWSSVGRFIIVFVIVRAVIKIAFLFLSE